MKDLYIEHDDDNGNASEDGKASDGEAPNLTQKKLGAQISLVRRMLGFTQTSFGDALGITPQTQSLLERGQVSSKNIYAKLYFSLAEIRADPDTFGGLEEYQRANIISLLDRLISYIRIGNTALNKIIKEHD